MVGQGTEGHVVSPDNGPRPSDVANTVNLGLGDRGVRPFRWARRLVGSWHNCMHNALGLAGSKGVDRFDHSTLRLRSARLSLDGEVVRVPGPAGRDYRRAGSGTRDQHLAADCVWRDQGVAIEHVVVQYEAESCLSSRAGRTFGLPIVPGEKAVEGKAVVTKVISVI
jgi:hypothetical protein